MMQKIAKRIIEEQNKTKAEEKLFFKAYLFYSEGNYKKAIKLFTKLDNPEAMYMKCLSHLKQGDFHEGITLLHDYEHVLGILTSFHPPNLDP